MARLTPESYKLALDFARVLTERGAGPAVYRIAAGFQDAHERAEKLDGDVGAAQAGYYDLLNEHKQLRQRAEAAEKERDTAMEIVESGRDAAAMVEMQQQNIDLRQRLAVAEQERDAALGPVPTGTELQKLGAWLATLLDDDRWPDAAPLLNAAQAERDDLLQRLAAVEAALAEHSRPPTLRESFKRLDALADAEAQHYAARTPPAKEDG